MNALRRLGVSVLLCTLCVGCVAPIRTRTRTVGAANPEPKPKFDLEFIQAGSTTREEVQEKLGWIDTGLKEERIFWGRWISSSWTVFWVVGGAAPGGGPVGDMGAERLWHGQNLLIEFDASGRVKRYRLFSDKALMRELSAWLDDSEGSIPDLSEPLAVPVRHRHAWDGAYPEARLVLGKDNLEFHEAGKGDHDFRLAPAKVSRLSFSGRFSREAPDPRYSNVTLHFREKVKAGNKLTVKVDMPSLLILASYLQQNGSQLK